MVKDFVDHDRVASVVVACVLVAMTSVLSLAGCAPAAAPAAPTTVVGVKPAGEPTKPAAQPSTEPIQLRAGSSNNQGMVFSDAIDKFAELVQEKTKGEVIVHVFYQSLGAEQQLAQAVMSGSVDMGNMSCGNSARFSDAFLVYDLPFLFKGNDIMLKSLEGPVGRQATAQFEKDLGVKVLMTQTNGADRDIQTRDKQLKVPADIKGLKIRVISSPVDLATFKAWGANPTPMDWGQVRSGLQQGVIDGMNVPIPPVLQDKYYDMIKDNLRIGYQSTFSNFFINAKKLASLSPQHQKAILDAGEEAKAWHYKDAVAKVEQIYTDLETKYHMRIYTPKPEEYTQWASIREKVWQDVGEEMKGKLDLSVARQLYQSQ